MIVINYPDGEFVAYPNGYLEINPKERNYLTTQQVAKLKYDFCTLWQPFLGTWRGYFTNQINPEGRVRYKKDGSFDCIAHEFFARKEISPTEEMRKYLDKFLE